MKAKYQAKYGRGISAPARDDVVLLGAVAPPTKDEGRPRGNKRLNPTGIDRQLELREYKQKRKERFPRVLARPTLAVFRDGGAIRTRLDNTRDALTALIVTGRIAGRMIPGVLGRPMLGPLGRLLTAAQIIDPTVYCGRQTNPPRPPRRIISAPFKKWVAGTKAPARAGR